MRRLLQLALLLAALALAVRWSYTRETRRPLLPPGSGSMLLSVPPGTSAAAVGRELHSRGLILHPLVFRALVRLRGAGAQLKAGDYEIEQGLSLEQLLERLVRGDVARRGVTIPEGRSLADMEQIVASHGLAGGEFRAAAADPTPIRDLDPQAEDLEGYLFPDTYDVPRRPGAAAGLVGRMLERFRSVTAPELPRIQGSGLTLRQVVTLASLVELETAQPEERPRIAAVFLNRLRRGMPLQTDPTVIYALRKAGRYDGNIRKQDLALDSPYNTYVRAGLPPGPIASPGRASLLAVLEPAPVKDLYFVARNDGTHEFSETLAQHERAVDRYQRRRAPQPPS